VHLDTALGAMVAQLAGVHYFDLGDAMPVYFRPQDVYVFDSAGMLALAPSREGVH
jgi:glycerol transport system ATP-binding protein